MVHVFFRVEEGAIPEALLHLLFVYTHFGLEQVLTHEVVLSILDARIPIESLLACVTVVDQRGEDLATVNFQVAEVTIVNILCNSPSRFQLVARARFAYARLSCDLIRGSQQHPTSTPN